MLNVGIKNCKFMVGFTADSWSYLPNAARHGIETLHISVLQISVTFVVIVLKHKRHLQLEFYGRGLSRSDGLRFGRFGIESW